MPPRREKLDPIRSKKVPTELQQRRSSPRFTQNLFESRDPPKVPAPKTSESSMLTHVADRYNNISYDRTKVRTPTFNLCDRIT